MSSKNKKTVTEATGNPWVQRLIFLFALIGIIVTVHLWMQAQRGFAGGCLGYSEPAAVADEAGCAVVVESAGGTLLGVSNIIWGILYYLVIAALAGARLFAGQTVAETLQKLSFALVSAGLAYSLYLFYYQSVVIGEYCQLCLISASVTLILFGLHLVMHLKHSGYQFTGRDRRGYAVAAVVAVLLMSTDIYALKRVDAMARTETATAAEEPSEPTTPEPAPDENQTAPDTADAASDDLAASGVPAPATLPPPLPACEYDAEMTPLSNVNTYIADTPYLGSANAPHNVIKFFDPNCPHCRTLHERLRPAVNQYSNTARFYFKPFPLWQFSQLQVQAIYLAGDAGRYYEMIELQFQNQKQGGLSLDELVALAGQLGLDQNEFRRGLTRGSARGRLIEEHGRIGPSILNKEGRLSVPKLTVDGQFLRRPSLVASCLASLQ